MCGRQRGVPRPGKILMGTQGGRPLDPAANHAGLRGTADRLATVSARPIGPESAKHPERGSAAVRSARHIAARSFQALPVRPPGLQQPDLWGRLRTTSGRPTCLLSSRVPIRAASIGAVPPRPALPSFAGRLCRG